MTALLTIRDLSVRFPTRFGEFTAIESLDLTVNAGELHGLVGESGAGKSTIGAAVIGLLQYPGYIASGELYLQDTNLRELDDTDFHALRGSRISMIFQDPQTSLNPLMTIADQLIGTITQHSNVSDSEARQRAIDLLNETGIIDAETRIDDYPHQFSGGMRQRVVIALALCTDPELIIADEPTTALDVSVQKQILALLRELAQTRQVGFILITHDIGVIAEITDRVTVLRHGRVMETGDTLSVLGNPQNEYTQALMAAVPRLHTRLERFVNIVTDDDDDSSSWSVEGASSDYAANWLNRDITDNKRSNTSTADTPVLSVNDLTVRFYKNRPGWFKRDPGFKALSDINFSMQRGEVLGIVGESGSGKSTLAKAIVGLVDPSSGSIHFNGEPLPPGSKRSRHHAARREIQMIFQDPFSSLNNRHTVEHILSEPVRFYQLASGSANIKKLIASILELVEMSQTALLKYPHQFSGGQRQRIAVARALIARPSFLVCDEPTSALDVSIQAQILNLLKDLQQTFDLSILFISHNLAVVRQMANSVVVLKEGELVETAETEAFFKAPKATYSQQLLAETPSLDVLDRPT